MTLLHSNGAQGSGSATTTSARAEPAIPGTTVNQEAAHEEKETIILSPQPPALHHTSAFSGLKVHRELLHQEYNERNAPEMRPLCTAPSITWAKRRKDGSSPDGGADGPPHQEGRPGPGPGLLPAFRAEASAEPGRCSSPGACTNVGLTAVEPTSLACDVS